VAPAPPVEAVKPAAAEEKVATAPEGKTAPAPEEKEEPAQPSGVVAELNSRQYHVSTCSSAKRLSKRNIIRYASADAAERAGKKPCGWCLAERAEKFSKSDKAASRRKLPGALIGLKSNTRFFYTPVAPQLKKVKVDDMIAFKTVAKAKASGRKPDPISMRLTALPGYPLELPEKGECIGRALPFYRPCRRDAKGPSGLCIYCAKGE
jgi:hypothetical protein